MKEKAKISGEKTARSINPAFGGELAMAARVDQA
jgi:hypothetical protein